MTCRSAPQPVTLEGHIEKVSFCNRENQFTIARFQVTGTDNLVTVLGLLPHPHPGSAMRITGTWETHTRYGQQLRIISSEMVLPASIDGIRQYLASGFVKGVGPRTIARLVNHFQGETLAVIENAPARLSEVMVEGAERQRTPNELALSILLAGLSIVFLVAVLTLQPFAIYSDAEQPVIVLIASVGGTHPDHDRRIALGDRHRWHGPTRPTKCARHEWARGRSRRRRVDPVARQDGHHHLRQPSSSRTDARPRRDP